MFYIYILYSCIIDKYYVGHSQDPWIRLIQHNNNPSDKYTGQTKDWELKAVFEVSENRGEGMKIEKFIKKQKSRKFIEVLIDENAILSGAIAHLVRVPHVRD